MTAVHLGLESIQLRLHELVLRLPGPILYAPQTAAGRIIFPFTNRTRQVRKVSGQGKVGARARPRNYYEQIDVLIEPTISMTDTRRSFSRLTVIFTRSIFVAQLARSVNIIFIAIDGVSLICIYGVILRFVLRRMQRPIWFGLTRIAHIGPGPLVHTRGTRTALVRFRPAGWLFLYTGMFRTRYITTRNEGEMVISGLQMPRVHRESNTAR